MMTPDHRHRSAFGARTESIDLSTGTADWRGWVDESACLKTDKLIEFLGAYAEEWKKWTFTKRPQTGNAPGARRFICPPSAAWVHDVRRMCAETRKNSMLSTCMDCPCYDGLFAIEYTHPEEQVSGKDSHPAHLRRFFREEEAQ